MSTNNMEAILPAYTSPAYQWVRKVKMVLASKKVAIDDGEEAAKYVGPVITRLPFELFELVSDAPKLKSLLQFIEDFDKPKSDAETLISSHQSQLRPSHQLSQIRDRLKSSLSALDDEGAKALSWQTVYNNFSDHIKQMCTVIGVTNYPTEEQESIIDKLWSSQSSGGIAAVSKSCESDKILERLKSVEQMVEKSVSHAAPPTSESRDLLYRIEQLEQRRNADFSYQTTPTNYRAPGHAQQFQPQQFRPYRSYAPPRSHTFSTTNSRQLAHFGVPLRALIYKLSYHSTLYK